MKHARVAHTGGRRRVVVLGGFAALLAAAVGITATNAFAGTSFSDNFNDGDSAGWSKSGGSWSVVTDGSKVLRQADAGAALARQFAGDSGWTDYSVRARVKALTLTGAGAAAGVVARAGGAHQFERLVLAPGAARLEEVRGSAVTVLGSAKLASAASGWHTLRLDVSGGRVRGFVDGSPVGDAATRLAKGRIGVLTTVAAAEFDDVTVGPAGNAPAPTASPTPTTVSPSPSKPSPTKPSPTKPSPSKPSPSKPAPTTPAPGGGSSSWPAPTGKVTLTATKKISGTFDGGNTEFIGGGDLGDGGQSENQGPLFDLADGSTLANVIIGAPAADGVHCLGTCTLKNVWWLDVGEDAATFKSTSASQTMTILGGGAKHAADKVFQHNGPGTLIINGFQAEDIGKLYRSCGNCKKQFARHVEVSNVTVTAPLKTLVGINPNLGDTAKITNATLIGATAKNVCALFKGVTSGEPTEVGNVPDGVACVATNITIK
jgi:pectate lyase